MKTSKSSLDPSVKITLKLRQGDKTTYAFTGTKRQLFYHRLGTLKFSDGYLRVTYQHGVFNDTIKWADKETLLWALRTFTEKSLVDDINSRTY